MAMTPRLRKLALTAHVTTSIGWIGAVAVFLALAIAGLTNQNLELVRSAYAVMGLIGWFVIVPFCFASLATGVVSSLGTSWGLIRYYWVVIKLAITVVATIVLLIHMQPITRIANLASGTSWTPAGLQTVRTELVVESAVALLALLVATALSTYKPQGRTPYGQRRPVRAAMESPAVSTSQRSNSPVS
ncbi:MAG: DUF2269 domain-containing protein [Leifsonia sp.]